MDPNNNQPINTNPFGQPVQQPAIPQPVATPFSSPVPSAQQPTPIPTPVPDAPTPIPQAPKRGSKKGIILLIILVILVLGMTVYILFVKNQLNTARKTATDNTSIAIPTTTPTAIPATVDEINVASPDADLKAIEDDVQGL